MTHLKLSLYILLLTGLAACGNQQNSTTQNHSLPPTNQEETIASSHLPETNALHIYNWADYVDPHTVSAFEKQYHVKVSYDYYNSDEELEAKVLVGKSGYDLTGPSNAFVGRQIKAGAYQKIDKSLLPNYHYINPKLLKLMQDVDPNNDYAVPFFWGINTLAINTERVKAALGNLPMPENEWDLVFNPQYTAKIKQCGISYLDSAAEMYPLALHYLGRNPQSDNPKDLQDAKRLLIANRPNIKLFSSSGYTDDLARGDTCAAVGFGGDLNITKRRVIEATGKDSIDVLMPKNGVGIWVDSWVIPIDAANVLNAHRYINWQLDPKIAAQNGNFVTYAPSSMPARELMDPEYAMNPTIFPTDDDLEHGFIMIPFTPETMKKLIRSWQEIKVKSH